MNTLRYKVRPNSTLGWSANLDLAPDLPEADLLTRLAARTGQSAETCRTVATGFIAELIAAAREGHACPNLFELIRTEPISPGDVPSNDGFRTTDDLKLDLRIALLPAARTALRSGLQIEKRDQSGLKTPIVTGQNCLTTEHANSYRAGDYIVILGHDLKLNRHDPKVGVFLAPVAGGPARRCTTYARTAKERIIVRVPEDLTGPLRLEVRSRIESSLRVFTYPSDLQPV
ncbi:MAG: DUF4469 domain-containing protein [Chthoniobacteraceae bacterium]